jgi:hypothetical protein
LIPENLYPAFTVSENMASVVDPKPRTEIKMPPGARAEITNCGSGSLLVITDLEEI